MADPKLTALQQQRVEQIHGFLKSVAHLRKLVSELDANRGARPQVLQQISSQIARECSQMRQRAISANIGTVADVAGALSTMAGRSAGLLMKIRGLNDGVASLSMQLEHALQVAQTPEKQERPSGPPPPPE
ncbi:MAG: hypothetical protein ACREMF_10195 [Gemmatimonadales bacterium]